MLDRCIAVRASVNTDVFPVAMMNNYRAVRKVIDAIDR